MESPCPGLWPRAKCILAFTMLNDSQKKNIDKAVSTGPGT